MSGLFGAPIALDEEDGYFYARPRSPYGGAGATGSEGSVRGRRT
jgi:hypothetical protein